MTSTMPQPAPRAADLATLLAALPQARVLGPSTGGVAGIVHDSRQATASCLFVALHGEHADGHAYIDDAAQRGARAIVVDEAHTVEHAGHAGITLIVVPDTRRALSALAKAYYDAPSAALDVIGITGTNGKTTTTHLVAALVGAGGVATGRIGTLGARLGGAHWSLDNTTPPALELQALLAMMRERGAAAVAMEVSSHALVLDRVVDVAFAFGVLTNVTRDHLDFHAGFEQYAGAKRRLFTQANHGILNSDDACGRRWSGELALGGRPVTTYGFSEDAHVRATEVELHAGGAAFSCGTTRFTLNLPGRFNVSNALAALCVARAFGVADATSARALADFERVPGRMEHIAGGGIDVLVDYAHTPDALDVVLRAVRESTRGQLCVVFGCGGDRDRGKRPEMGRIASELADRTIVTSDNPRCEDPRAIVAEIVAGCKAGRVVHAEVDRRSAIRAAITHARPRDVVVVAGKGHETYQIVGERAGHFDDRDEVRAALALRGDNGV